MARINSRGEVEHDVWKARALNETVDESKVYADGEVARRGGFSKYENPWPRNTYAHLVWYDGWLNAG